MKNPVMYPTSKITDRGTYIYHFRIVPGWLRQSPNSFHLLAEFARRARRVADYIGWQGQKIKLEVNQFITGSISTSQQLGLSRGEYRVAYNRLEQWGFIKTVRTTKRFTIGELLENAPFDINVEPSEQPSEKPSASQPSATNKNEKNEQEQSRIENNHQTKQKEGNFDPDGVSTTTLNSPGYQKYLKSRQKLFPKETTR